MTEHDCATIFATELRQTIAELEALVTTVRDAIATGLLSQHDFHITIRPKLSHAVDGLFLTLTKATDTADRMADDIAQSAMTAAITECHRRLACL